MRARRQVIAAAAAAGMVLGTSCGALRAAGSMLRFAVEAGEAHRPEAHDAAAEGGAPGTAISSGAVQEPVAQQAAAAQPPADLQRFVAEMAKKFETDRAAAQRELNAVSRAIEKAVHEGEDRLWAGLILARASRRAPAVKNLEAYLSSPSPANRELALAFVVEAGSWEEPMMAGARRAYAEYMKSYGESGALDPLRPGVPLRVGVEEAMARVSLLDGENTKAAGEHYRNALDAIARHKASLPFEDYFRLRTYYADSLEADGKLGEAVAFLEAMRSDVKHDPKTAARLEDFITFKRVHELSEERKFAEARDLVRKNIPSVEADPISVKRLTKLLGRLELVGGPAPEFAGPMHWVGGEPRTLASLRGHVVLLEFLTSG
ncbi:MAG: hypothetical protein ACE148_17005 [Vicinamibacterales bacterium]